MDFIRKEKIGHGSFSTVSLATTSKTSTSFPPLIAVKSTGVVYSAALINERNVLDSLGYCSEIVRCYGEGKTVENGEEIYNLFLEYASGGNLNDLVKNSDESLPEFEVRRFTKSIVKGLIHIHESGFIHSDLKLENVLVFDYGIVKISDFGLAKPRSEAKPISEIRGTPMYMAPESVSYGEFESPVDIWGLGCCVVEMCSGKTAWCLEDGLLNVMLRIGFSDEIPEIPVWLSEEGKDFLKKCFVKNSSERWTAKMLLDHPFLAVDDALVRVGLVSPRDPFDFPGWNSVQSPVKENLRFGNLVRLPEERISGLVTENGPDWSVMCDWVNVR